MRDNVNRPRRHWLLLAGLAIAPVVAASILGNIATLPNIPGWYAGLAKPWFNPPNWVFGPAWTTLYAMMAVAFYRILQLPDFIPGRKIAIGLFLAQITLNAAWSWAFFAANSPLAGLIVVIAMWLTIAATLIQFWKLDRTAGALLIPYLAWVSFASVLNAAIWRLNP
jgi:translocator protein